MATKTIARAKQVEAAVGIIAALAEAIRELGSVPSGHLYAQVMGSIDLDTYTRSLDILKGAGLIEVKSDVIRWIGPKFNEAITS